MKVWSMDLWGSLRSFQQIREIETILIILRCHLLFFGMLTFALTDGTKAVMSKIAGTLP